MTADTNHSSTPNLHIAHHITSLGTLSKAFSKALKVYFSQLSYKTRNMFYGTRYLSHCSTCFACNPLFVNRVTSLTPRVTWCHWSHDDWNHSSLFSIHHPL